MAEKCIRSLPAVRVSDTLETALMRMAAVDDRSLSEYIRLTLERHAFGHASSVMLEGGGVTGNGASQCSTEESRGSRL